MITRARDARWLLGVVGHDDGSTAVIAYLAGPDMLDAVTKRLRAGGWERVNAHDWGRGNWPVARAGGLHGAVDVYGGELIRFTTGKASFYAAPGGDTGMPMTPMWMSAARERRVLVVTLPDDPDLPEQTGDDPEKLHEILTAAAAGRSLWAGLCEVRFDVFHPQMRAPEARR